jgi:hypothetical protein
MVESGRMQGEKGQTIVEFALVAGFLFLTLFGIVDFSRLFFAYATMSHGVREGARYGIIHPDDVAGIEALVQERMVLIGGQATVTVSFPGKDDGTDVGCKASHYCRVVIYATSDLDVWTPVIPSITVEAKVTMHVE